ncbi:MAG: site-specific integrase, partial [Pirellulaceae bacterium]
PMSDIHKILDVVPNLYWKALVLLWRVGGLRRDEALLLKWDDVLWNQQKLRVPSPKTSRYGKGERIIPLWPSLEAVLGELFEQTAEGTEQIISIYASGQNLGTEFGRIIERAGVTKWPRLIQNLRSSCQNDLELSGHRMSVIAEWIGNSESVARKHYLGVTDQDFQRAQDLNPFTSIVRQVVQHPAAEGCTASHKKNQGSQKANKKGHLHVPAPQCNPLQMALAPPVGLEPTT